jgi:hypothetical protein
MDPTVIAVVKETKSCLHALDVNTRQRLFSFSVAFMGNVSAEERSVTPHFMLC